MNRKDSGYIETSPLEPLKQQTTTLQRNDTTHQRCHTARTGPASVDTADYINMTASRPASEKRPRPTNQRSASSSENSTTRSRSKGRGHDSKLSSRRTSCTIVDPSRPARHYRVKSIHTTSPTSQDVDDVLALHFRSCNLFSNPSYQTNSALPSPMLSHENFGFPSAAPRFSMDEMAMVQEHVSLQEAEDACLTTPPTTTMHWTSSTTRKRDYERIDKQNTGFRGLVRRAVPRCVSGPPERFYEKDQSDAGSVRRYRLDVIESHRNEKELTRPSTKSSQSQRPRPKTRWTCF